jgi:hypothetical protein
LGMAHGREGAKRSSRSQNGSKFPHWAPPVSLRFFLSPKERNFLSIVKV